MGPDREVRPHARSPHFGCVDLGAGVALLLGSLPTIALLRRVTGRVPDRIDSGAYVALLVVVLLVLLALGI